MPPRRAYHRVRTAAPRYEGEVPIVLSPAVFLVQVVLACAGALAPRAVAGVVIAMIVALPWAISEDAPFFRGVSALLAVLLTMRGIELLSGGPRGWIARVVHSVSVPDLRLAQRAEPVLEARLLATGVACGVLALAALLLAVTAPAEWEASALVRRWGLGTVAFYLLFEAVDRLGRAAYAALGFIVEPTQRAPVLARSLGEFWGRRWNAIVRRWLGAVVYVPITTRFGPRRGRFAAFVVSATLHAWLVLPALGVAVAAQMGTFFLIHGALVWLERPIGIRRAPRALGHLWTLTTMGLTAPLFIECILRICGARALP